MIFYPAIDIQNGKCVRLRQGKVDKTTIFNSNPLRQAQEFIRQGSEWLHVVDLDAAMSRSNINRRFVKELVGQVDVPIQLGGGIREIKTVEYWLNLGVERIILGTVALKDPDLVRLACKKFPKKIALGLDAKDGKLSLSGWKESSGISTLDFLTEVNDYGISRLIFTDINKDGTKESPNFEETLKVAEISNCPVIISGGVSSIEDIKKAKTLKNIEGVIVGKAIYDGDIKLEELAKEDA